MRWQFAICLIASCIQGLKMIRNSRSCSQGTLLDWVSFVFACDQTDLAMKFIRSEMRCHQLNYFEFIQLFSASADAPLHSRIIHQVSGAVVCG